MPRRMLVFVAVVTACSPNEEPDQAISTAAGVTVEQFRTFHWIAGSWRGSGGAYPAFFEEYRVVNDSTIQMRAFSDSTFSVATDSSWIELRNGTIMSRGSRAAWTAVEFTDTFIRFARPGQLGGHTFVRASADEWTATLHPSVPDGETTVYTMRRVPRPDGRPQAL